MKIGIVAGEASGDILGAGLITELQKRYPQAIFAGIGGPQMLSQGFQSLFPQERLAVMGIVEPLKRLPELLSIRKQLLRYFTEQQFDLIVGIDSPDFNLTLEEKLKRSGMKTVHYVSPSVWAWRQGRIHKIARAVDLMLTLLPFETAIYQQHSIPVRFVGHPLADQFPVAVDNDKNKAVLKKLLGTNYDPSKPLLACLPGSRGGEVKLIGPILLAAIARCREAIPDLQVVIPAANAQRRQQVETQLEAYSDLPITLIDGHSHEVMAAAELVLLASGTTALEAMLLKKPMVVVYKLAPLSYWIISRLLKTPYVALPNLLADELLVPELIQDQAEPELIANTVIELMQSPEKQSELTDRFTALHQQLNTDASYNAAEAIAQLLEAQ